MKYTNPNVKSSYQENNLGKVLYDYILQTKPKKIIEFGTLYGYSAIAMAMAIDELDNDGKIVCYDLWDKYPYTHSVIEETKQNFNCKMEVWKWDPNDPTKSKKLSDKQVSELTPSQWKDAMANQAVSEPVSSG